MKEEQIKKLLKKDLGTLKFPKLPPEEMYNQKVIEKEEGQEWRT